MAKRSQLLPAYLIVGTDALKRDRALKRLKQYVPEESMAFNYDELTASADMVPENVIINVQTMPFCADIRLVIIKEAHRLPKPVSEALITYFNDPNPSCVVCLVAETLAKTTRLRKAIEKLGARTVITCAAHKRWELPALVIKFAEEHGKVMREAAAQELVSRVGENTVQLDAQINTLTALVGEREEITRSDVENYVARTTEVKPWDFLDAVCERDGAKAMTLYTLMQNPSLLMLESLLATRIRELICAKALEARGSSKKLAEELKRQAWQVKNHSRWARNFTMDELTTALTDAALCERALKGSKDSDNAFTNWVLTMCSRSA